MRYTLSSDQLADLIRAGQQYPGESPEALFGICGIENPESETYGGMAHDFEQMRAALRKCLPSKSHMNCSAEDFRGDEHIAVVLHREEWERIAELASTPDELKGYLLYKLPPVTTLADYDLAGYKPGLPLRTESDDGLFDRDVAEQNPCQRCGGKCEFHPYTNGNSYRAFAVCTKCGNAVEF